MDGWLFVELRCWSDVCALSSVAFVTAGELIRTWGRVRLFAEVAERWVNHQCCVIPSWKTGSFPPTVIGWHLRDFSLHSSYRMMILSWPRRSAVKWLGMELHAEEHAMHVKLFSELPALADQYMQWTDVLDPNILSKYITCTIVPNCRHPLGHPIATP